jgi:hypothetical protein
LRTLTLLVCLTACSETATEAKRVQVELWGGSIEASSTPSDTGWTVELDSAQFAATNLELTILGETHLAQPTQRWPAVVWSLFGGTARAHPGHYAGGEVTGEVVGPFVVNYGGAGAQALARGEALAGDYNGANLTFTHADALGGASVRLVGRATDAEGTVVPFDTALDLDEGVQVVGLPYDADLGAGEVHRVSLVLQVRDDETGGHLFDGIDFQNIGAAETNRLRRQLVRHDFHALVEAPGGTP